MYKHFFAMIFCMFAAASCFTFTVFGYDPSHFGIVFSILSCIFGMICLGIAISRS